MQSHISAISFQGGMRPRDLIHNLRITSMTKESLLNERTKMVVCVYTYSFLPFGSISHLFMRHCVDLQSTGCFTEAHLPIVKWIISTEKTQMEWDSLNKHISKYITFSRGATHIYGNILISAQPRLYTTRNNTFWPFDPGFCLPKGRPQGPFQSRF